jgi:hypothetical protein
MSNLSGSLELRTNDGCICVFDDSYGELGIMFKGPRNGERGYDKLSKSQVTKLIEFLNFWMEEPEK